MILDGDFNFGIPAITNSNTATASTNVFDAGSAVLLFTGRKAARCVWKTVMTADGGTLSITVDVVGSAAAALTAPDLIASSGVVLNTADGTAIQTTETVYGDVAVYGQTTARRYYGLLVTLGGTNPDTVAATSFGHIVLDAASNLLRAQAAIPAT